VRWSCVRDALADIPWVPAGCGRSALSPALRVRARVDRTVTNYGQSESPPDNPTASTPKSRW
jgi:hypothetical protein